MSDLRYRVLLADTLDEPGLEVLRRGGCELIDAANEERSVLVDRVFGCHGLIVRSRTKVSRELLAGADDLRVIGCSGIGVDNVDLEAATERDIAVVNTPTANVIAATELTMSLILSVARRLTPANASLAAGEWERRRFRGFELAGKTLGIVGFGRIGRQVAARAAAFGMTVVATDPFLEPAVARRFAVEFLSLQELLAAADVVTIHTPLSPETRHLINAERLGWMKPGAILVNCARGGILDERAVFEALEAGELAGVGLDVHEHEPPRDLRLVRHPRVVATPHIGAQTEEAQHRVAVEVAERLLAVLDGSGAVDTVNLPARLLDRRARTGLALARRLGALAAAMLGLLHDRGGAPGEGMDLAVELRGLDEGTAPRLTNAVLGSALGVLAGVEVGDLQAAGRAKGEGISISCRSAPVTSAGERLVKITATQEAVSVRIAGSFDPAGNPLLTAIDGSEASVPLTGPLFLVATDDERAPLSFVLSILEREGCGVTALASCAREGGGGLWLTISLTSAPSDAGLRSILSASGVAGAAPVPAPGEEVI